QLQLIEGLLNVQHNCHDAGCSLEATKGMYVECTLTLNKTNQLVHKKTNSYILNSAALYSGELHQHWADLHLPSVTAGQWRSTIRDGLIHW
ncbi:hypothetical protein CROQUDRAFT_18982, partial [Cronartium quercuum f. sp. fusiforme G11]